MNKYPKQVSGDIFGTCHEDKDKNVKVNASVVLVVNFTWKVSSSEVNSFELVCNDVCSWIFTENMKLDHFPIPSTMEIDTGTLVERVLPITHAFPQQVFEVNDIEIFTSNTVLLNDICINGCSMLLYWEYLSPLVEQIMISSTHDLLCIQHNTTDSVLWCNMK